MLFYVIEVKTKVIVQGFITSLTNHFKATVFSFTQNSA